MTNLLWLQTWYASRCNGAWEHQYGLELETVDNPGWGLRVDLHGTTHADAVLGWRRLDRTEGDWIHWCVHHSRFVGYCGAANLEELVAILREFLETPAFADLREGGRTSLRDGQEWRVLMHDPRATSIPSYEPDAVAAS